MHVVRPVALALVLAFAWLGVARPGNAADEPKIEVRSLSLEGVRQVDASQLRAALATRVSSRLPWGKRALFDRAKFQTDLERVKAFYADRGFPEARVTSFDVRFNEAKDKVDLTLTVSEGAPIRVAAIEFVDIGDVPTRRVEELKHASPLKVGQPLDRPALAAMREMVLNLLRDSGYPFARVTAEPASGADPRSVTVRFRVDPGLKSYFGRTSVTGTLEVTDGLVRRSLLYREGDLYRRSVVQESQRRLYDLELFQFVSLRPNRGERASPSPSAADTLPAPMAPTASRPRLDSTNPDPTRVPMIVTVTEGKHRRVQFAGGFGTEDKVRVEGQYRRLNFFGGARTGAIRAKWSSLDRGVRVEFTNPYFFSPRWSFQLSGERWYDNEPAFTAVTSGAHAIFTYRPSSKNTFSVTLTDEYQSSEIANAALSDLEVRSELIALGLDPTTGSQTGTVNSVALDFRRTTAAPSPVNAMRGYALTFHVERAGRWVGGTYAYFNASVEARHYASIGPNFVVATRAQVGSLRPDGNIVSGAPFSRRYFLGGASSLRGWGRYELSPLSASGLPVGGFSVAEATVEARVAVTRTVGAVVFLDLGNVWTEPWRLHLDDLRYDVGPGLRYNTPVGPLRLDVGYQLNPVPGLLIDGKPQKRRWRLHFSIGQAF